MQVILQSFRSLTFLVRPIKHLSSSIMSNIFFAIKAAFLKSLRFVLAITSSKHTFAAKSYSFLVKCLYTFLPISISSSIIVSSLKEFANARISGFCMMWCGIMGWLKVNPSKERIRLMATYAWPAWNVPLERSKCMRSKVIPCDLWIVIAHANLIGYCVNEPIMVDSILRVSRLYWLWIFSQLTWFTSISLPFSSLTRILFSSKAETLAIVPFI